MIAQCQFILQNYSNAADSVGCKLCINDTPALKQQITIQHFQLKYIKWNCLHCIQKANREFKELTNDNVDSMCEYHCMNSKQKEEQRETERESMVEGKEKRCTAMGTRNDVLYARSMHQVTTNRAQENAHCSLHMCECLMYSFFYYCIYVYQMLILLLMYTFLS